MSSVILTASRHEVKASSTTRYVLNTERCAVTSYDGASQLHIYSTRDLFSYDQSVFQFGFCITHMERGLKSLI